MLKKGTRWTGKTSSGPQTVSLHCSPFTASRILHARPRSSSHRAQEYSLSNDCFTVSFFEPALPCADGAELLTKHTLSSRRPSLDETRRKYDPEEAAFQQALAASMTETEGNSICHTLALASISSEQYLYFCIISNVKGLV